MRINIEIPEDWMIRQLQEDCEICFSSSLPEKMHLMREHDIANMISSIETCNAINKIIQYYGGSPVDLTTIKPHKSEELSAEDVEILEKVLKEG
jgi:hypothetical protein